MDVSSLIVVEDYNIRWKEDYRELRDLYLEFIGHLSGVDIEHVGSTSVQGLAAKPIIDIDVIVDSDKIDLVISKFEAHGFINFGEMGITGRWGLKNPKIGIQNNTYVVERNSPAVINHLILKQALTQNVELRDAYAELKRALAAQATDIDAYTKGKTDFIIRILRTNGVSEQIVNTVRSQNL
jgi:GrpB-like predicted nucleotidyltransferase (UPF0157 family)